MEHEYPRKPLRRAEGNEAAEHALHREQRAVQDPPQRERPARPVPEPAQEHGEHEVRVGSRLPLARAAQGDVEVVAEPRRERDVPAAPERLEAVGEIGRVEIDRELEAQQQRAADRDVGVGREVAVDLQGVGVHAHERVEGAEFLRHGEERVREVRGEVVRDDHLLEEPREDEHARARGIQPRLRPRQVLHRRDEVARTDDRSGHELREEGKVVREVDPAPRGLDLAARHVDHVAQRLEGVEGYAHGEDDRVQKWLRRLQEGDPRIASAKPAGHLHPQRGDRPVEEESRVLEEHEHPDVERDRQHHRQPARPIPSPGHPQGEAMVDDGRREQHQRKRPAPPAVEHETRGEQHQLPQRDEPPFAASIPLRQRRQAPVEAEDDREEHGERQGREQHQSSFPLGMTTSVGFAPVRPVPAGEAFHFSNFSAWVGQVDLPVCR